MSRWQLSFQNGFTTLQCERNCFYITTNEHEGVEAVVAITLAMLILFDAAKKKPKDSVLARIQKGVPELGCMGNWFVYDYKDGAIEELTRYLGAYIRTKGLSKKTFDKAILEVIEGRKFRDFVVLSRMKHFRDHLNFIRAIGAQYVIEKERS